MPSSMVAFFFPFVIFIWPVCEPFAHRVSNQAICHERTWFTVIEHSWWALLGLMQNLSTAHPRLTHQINHD
jgi:hypothetical protein